MTATSDKVLKIQLRSANATVPTKGSATAAGYDIYASQDITIPAMGQGMVSTDISFTVPVGTYGRIAPRSGLAVKNGIQTGAGVVDRDYTGEVKVVLFNHSQRDFAIKKGDRVAQLILEKIVDDAQIVVVDSLEESARGAGGFGSTGN
ncbi:Dut1p [Saccharomyces cerevisiae YJM1443]|nr:Dut1p [Saccharomyces cerevisiae YJM1443]